MPHPNIEWANRALAYVASKAVRANNRDADRAILADIDARVSAMDLAYMGTETPLNTKLKEIKRWAELGESHGVGNCEVQASIAFAFLAKQNGRPTIEMMGLNASGDWPETVSAAITGREEEFGGPDHVLLVLGRVGGSIPDYKTWNFGAVVCDPWAKRCYHAAQFEGEMQLIRRVSGGSTRTVQMAELQPGANW